MAAKQEIVNEVIRATPSTSMLGAKLVFGVAVADWVLLASGLLITLQIVFLLRDKLYRPWKDKRNARRNRT